jgi:hypothetical protein
MAAAAAVPLAAMPLIDALAASRGGGRVQSFRAPSRAPVFRPHVFRPVQHFTQRPVQHFTPQTHVNRHPPRFTQSGNSGVVHTPKCHTHCGQLHPIIPNNPHPTPNPSNVQQTQKPVPVLPPKPGPGSVIQVLKFGPGKPVSLKGPFKPTFPVVNVKNKFWPLLKGPKFIWFAGKRHFFVPVGLLGVTLIGGSYWYPDGYVSIAGPLCAGFTPDGCQLEWRMVGFEDGGEAAQCVQYCPQSGPPPAQVVTLPPPPALVQNGACHLTIYENPNFAGLAAPTSDNQPVLSETGWKDEISSIEVQSGTWDFYSAENFSGESVRMAAGSYPMLAAEWNKRIGSFMCVEPGSPGA